MLPPDTSQLCYGVVQLWRSLKKGFQYCIYNNNSNSHLIKLLGAWDIIYELHGVIETDEIIIGDKQTLAEKRQHGNNKTPFFMAVQEDEKSGPTFVTFEEIEGIYESQILPAIEKHIKKGSKIISDGEDSYVGSTVKDYDRDRYVESQAPKLAHEKLQWINMLTSNLKRFLLSTHHGVYPKCRKKYLAEFAYRLNRRYWLEKIFDRLLYDCIHANPVILRELKT